MRPWGEMSLHILYLEDSAADASLVLSRLLQSGLDVDLRVVHTREDFTTHLADADTDLVMCDNAVPGFTGLAAIHEVKSRSPGLAVLLLSSGVDPKEASRCLDEGASDVVLKSELWRLPHTIRRTLREAPIEPKQERTGWARLVSVVQALSMARDMQTIMSIVRKAARDLTGADGATFVLREGDNCYYADEDAIAPLWKGSRFPMSRCISGWVMLNRVPAVIPDIYADPRIPADAYRPTFVKSLAMVPIRTDAPLGAIGNYWATPHTPTPDDLALLAALADTTSVAIENVQLYSNLETRVRQRTDELEATNHELEAFSYSVSHDLRSPISAIKGLVELLEDENGEALGADGRDVLKMINSTGTRMLSQIDAMLSLAKLNRVQVTRQTVNVSDMAQAIITELRTGQPHRTVQVSIEPDIYTSVDPDLFRVALENLISNAWKYTARRTDASIRIGREAGAPETFFVADNGAGFDMSKADWLFTPFHRLHADADFPGSGVGLATTQRIITRHGGKIWVESKPDVGTTFFFTVGAEDSATKA